MPKKTKPKRTREQQQLSNLIVAKFVFCSETGEPKCPSSRWGQQRAMAYKLIEKYPEKDFWVSLPANDQVFSLAYYLTDLGIQRLNSHKMSRECKDKSFESMTSKPEEKKEFKPVTTFEVTGHKQKTKMDFLRGEE